MNAAPTTMLLVENNAADAGYTGKPALEIIDRYDSFLMSKDGGKRPVNSINVVISTDY
ncbi:hypothetical protein [Rugosibacter aromaticivorans]|uniref:hypothetical protein n=1 Tax=Rugosibacter aromaticivorans TaxID=1565605 RepID=UPI00192A5989|nr:hypothetical protein [Rugosibacter aromaticivorans]